MLNFIKDNITLMIAPKAAATCGSVLSHQGGIRALNEFNPEDIVTNQGSLSQQTWAHF